VPLRVIHGRLTATAAHILDQQPDNLLDLGLSPYETPRGKMLADLNTVDASTARQRPAHCWADDRLSRLAGSLATSSVFTCSGLGHAAELRRPTKRWSPSCLLGPACIPTTVR